MKMKTYIENNEVFLGINMILFIVSSMFMYFANTSLVVIFMIFCIWFLPLLTYMIIDYMRYKKYIDNLKDTLANLDKKYLIAEMLKEANFAVEEEINYILEEISRDMHEHVKYYRDMQEEYREYIEMWVHEIKTPIASTNLLIENNINEITRKIQTQMNRIENFVEQVLYYSRSDEVGKDYIIQKIELSTVVKKVIIKNKRDFISKRISLQLDDINKIIYSDTKWIEFILNQIIGNAIKYSKDHNDKIILSSKKVGNSVVLIVEDNGVGIVDRDINRVFEKGFTGENGRKFGKSTGIGLYLCKKLCKKLGLDLKVESKINEGTKVSIVFPISDNLIETY